MNHPTLGNGKICYIEIPALDIAQSASFYQKVFGWNIRTRGDGSVSFDDGVGEVSGVWTTERKSVATPGMIIHIMVDDAQKSVDAVLANGGKIIQPIDPNAPEITAYFADPAGNMWGIYQQRE